MKIIHMADCHLDSSLSTHLDKDRTKERKIELLSTFEGVFDYAKNNDVKIILIAGDLFDSNKVASKTKNNIFNIIKKYEDIEVIYLPGNHDEESFMKELTSECPSLKVFDEEWKSLRFDNVVITGIINNLKTQKYLYNTLSLNKDELNIVTMHGQVGEYGDEDIKISRLVNKNIDYLALGHIHTYSKEKLDERGIYSYSGCLEGRGFDEDGPKGFVLIDTNDNKIETTFIPFAKRTLHKIHVDITSCFSWLDVQKDIDSKTKNIASNDMVEVILEGKYLENFIKQVELLDQSLNRKYYFAKVKDLTSLEVNVEDYENEISLKGEFIRLVSDLDDETDKNEIIELGLKALKGEEL